MGSDESKNYKLLDKLLISIQQIWSILITVVGSLLL